MIYLKKNYTELFNKITIISGLIVFATLFAFYLIGQKHIVSGLSICIFIFSFYTFKKGRYKFSSGLLIGLLIFLIGSIIRGTLSISEIREWDFLCLYHFGKIGVSDGSFYNPIHSFQVFDSWSIKTNVSESFIDEIVNVGFWYPPPTMFLFITLGFFKIDTANILWNGFVLLTLLISLLLILKLFVKKGQHWNNTLFLITIFLIYSATKHTLAVSQTNFLILIFLVLIIKNLDNWKAGLFLAFAIIIKPIAIFWGLYFLVFKRFKALLAIIITGILFSILTGIIFGFEQYSEYFISPPTKRIPQLVYSEDINQSLNSVLIRVSSNFTFIGNKIIKYSSISLSILFLIINVFLSVKLEKNDPKLAFMSFIPFSLIIYPAALSHYSVFMIPIYCYYLSEDNNNSIIVILICALFGIYYSAFLTHLFILIIIYLKIKDPIRNTSLFDICNKKLKKSLEGIQVNK